MAILFRRREWVWRFGDTPHSSMVSQILSNPLRSTFPPRYSRRDVWKFIGREQEEGIGTRRLEEKPKSTWAARIGEKKRSSGL